MTRVDQPPVWDRRAEAGGLRCWAGRTRACRSADSPYGAAQPPAAARLPRRDLQRRLPAPSRELAGVIWFSLCCPEGRWRLVFRPLLTDGIPEPQRPGEGHRHPGCLPEQEAQARDSFLGSKRRCPSGRPARCKSSVSWDTDQKGAPCCSCWTVRLRQPQGLSASALTAGS